jgi:hypothetical protein
MPDNIAHFAIEADDLTAPGAGARRFYESVFEWRITPWGPTHRLLSKSSRKRSDTTNEPKQLGVLISPAMNYGSDMAWLSRNCSAAERLFAAPPGFPYA